MAKKRKLKGCPFCGGKAHWRKGNKETRMPDYVGCLDCSAVIEGEYKPMSSLEMWNIRTADYCVMKNDREVNIDGENL